VIEARFGHVNLVAADWRLLADFYERVFGCVFVPPERDLGGPVFEAGTGVPGATVRGAHLRLPGLGENGPTLEIFQYGAGPERPATAINRPGFGHIAFAVPESPSTQMRVGTAMPAGGALVNACAASPPASVSDGVPTA